MSMMDNVDSASDTSDRSLSSRVDGGGVVIKFPPCATELSQAPGFPGSQDALRRLSARRVTCVRTDHVTLQQLNGNRMLGLIGAVSEHLLLAIKNHLREGDYPTCEIVKKTGRVKMLEEGLFFVPDVPPLPKTFSDALEYRRVFLPLVENEKRASIKQAKESRFTTDIEWNEVYEDDAMVAVFGIFVTENARVQKGSLLKITLCEETRESLLRMGEAMIADFSSSAVVESVHRQRDGYHVGLELQSDEAVLHELLALPTLLNRGSGKAHFDVEDQFNNVPYTRMKTALDALLLGGNHMADLIIGCGSPRTLPEVALPPNLFHRKVPLNPSQEAAVRSVFREELSLIQGPPGTGKTATIANIAYFLNKYLCKAQGTKLLVCAPSNTAVDNLAERIAKTGLNVVRVLSKYREGMPSEIAHLTLNRRIVDRSKMAAPGSDRWLVHTKLHEKPRRSKKILSSEELEDMKRQKKKFEAALAAIIAEIWLEADVICTTCSTAADKRLKPSVTKFSHVIIDESTQACEPEILIPIMRFKPAQVVLVGDHCQLGPVVHDKVFEAAGYGRSMFQRLVESGRCVAHRLEIQYRMHPTLARFPSDQFYDGSLRDGVTANDRVPCRGFPWPDPARPMLFLHHTHEETRDKSSKVNKNEAVHVLAAVQALLSRKKRGVRPADIGVISMYKAQQHHLEKVLLGLPAVEVASVDSFQGREKDYIVVSCVRSNKSRAVGFLTEWRRLNVAITRARRGLIIVGNAETLAADPVWRQLLQHLQTAKCLATGSVSKLRIVDDSAFAEMLPSEDGDTASEGECS